MTGAVFNLDGSKYVKHSDECMITGDALSIFFQIEAIQYNYFTMFVIFSVFCINCQD